MIPAIIVAALSRGPGTALIVAVAVPHRELRRRKHPRAAMARRTLGLSPLCGALEPSLLGWMWGPLGAVLSVPLLGSEDHLREHTGLEIDCEDHGGRSGPHDGGGQPEIARRTPSIRRPTSCSGEAPLEKPW